MGGARPLMVPGWLLPRSLQARPLPPPLISQNPSGPKAVSLH